MKIGGAVEPDRRKVPLRFHGFEEEADEVEDEDGEQRRGGGVFEKNEEVAEG